MYGKLKEFLTNELEGIKAAGLYKNERIITTPQRADIKVNAGSDVLNFCANNYLGLSDNQRLIKAAKEAMDTHGYGMSSVRFICGTQDLHKQLEAAISDYFKTEDTILYAACFDANGGLFEPLFGEEDAIISDALNHASIIDGVYARRNVIATLTPIWRTWSVAYKRRRPNVTVSSPRTACSPWTAMSLRWTRFASLPRNMTHWLWWTSLTLPVS